MPLTEPELRRRLRDCAADADDAPPAVAVIAGLARRRRRRRLARDGGAVLATVAVVAVVVVPQLTGGSGHEMVRPAVGPSLSVERVTDGLILPGGDELGPPLAGSKASLTPAAAVAAATAAGYGRLAASSTVTPGTVGLGLFARLAITGSGVRNGFDIPPVLAWRLVYPATTLPGSPTDAAGQPIRCEADLVVGDATRRLLDAQWQCPATDMRVKSGTAMTPPFLERIPLSPITIASNVAQLTAANASRIPGTSLPLLLAGGSPEALPGRGLPASDRIGPAIGTLGITASAYPRGYPSAGTFVWQIVQYASQDQDLSEGIFNAGPNPTPTPTRSSVPPGRSSPGVLPDAAAGPLRVDELADAQTGARIENGGGSAPVLPTPPVGGVPPRCSPDQLAGTRVGSGALAGRATLTIRVINVSAVACTINGYPTLATEGSAGFETPVLSRQLGETEVPTIRLRVGEGTAFVLSTPATCSQRQGTPRDPVVTEVQVGLSGGVQDVTVSGLSFDTACGDLQVSAFGVDAAGRVRR